MQGLSRVGPGMKTWSWSLLKLSITSGLLYYILKFIPLSEVIASISSANVGYIVVAILIALPMFYFSACQMKVLTDKQGMSVSTRKILEINLITRFYSLFLPGNLSGGAIRWYKLSQPDSKWAEALASMAFSRLFNTIILVILGVCFFLTFDIGLKSHGLMGLGLILFLGGLLLLYFLSYRAV